MFYCALHFVVAIIQAGPWEHTAREHTLKIMSRYTTSDVTERGRDQVFYSDPCFCRHVFRKHLWPKLLIYYQNNKENAANPHI